jgi:ATP-dependent Clp endopeptidase proteolytic subunit ClpP|tara:strand:+ start:975 stop:1622 length:648 start_codon:yes stop_codon:yes gene_type:complete
MQRNWKYRGNVAEENEPQIYQPIVISQGGMDIPQPGGGIRVVENTIYFYDDVTEESMLELNKTLLEVDLKLQNTKNILGEDAFTPIIHLHINTYGGGIFAAFSTVDAIRNLKSKVYTYADGSVASAGTLLLAVGDKRFVGKHAHVLIHQLSSGMYGKFSEIEDEMYNLINLMKLLKKFYKEHTKIPMKNLDTLLKKDLWMEADECVRLGIVDEIK